ncbi:M1 family metallopeptidase [Marisediminitalea aggregata]|uniref:M1 family metallopeptidase n=1 Tax=Marisediminitalea aggregata TaxID=634436 RepID=UPI0020CE82C2|nr:M1 family metallopeptidase [Marisediminitalea aggregata]MCP9477119.1 M1 family metallopeptidase [Marisediminitalea aggregata]
MVYTRIRQLTAIAAAVAITSLSACSSTESSDVVEATESTPYSLKSGGQVAPLQQGLTVEHADLTFAFDFDNKILMGTTTLTLKGEGSRSAFSVDLDSVFSVNSVAVNGESLAASQYRNVGGELQITPSSEVALPLTVTISYEGQPRIPVRAPWDGGVMWEKTPDGSNWLATAVQGEGCDLFWPCIDQPHGEPNQTDLHIQVPKPLVAASNGVLVDVTDNGDTRTYHWQTRSAHNTYGIALNIAPYEKLETTYSSIYGNTYPIVYYHLPGNEQQAKVLFDEIPTMLTFFERMIGPYPFGNEKVGVAQTPHLGMEHQTINAYGNEYKKDEFGFDWLLQHEFAHEYFGNQVTNDNWDHMWIHEGLGSYMQPLFAQYLSGDVAYMTYLNNQRKGLINTHPIVSNKLMEVEQVYERGVGPALDIYYKGSWIMHTLRNLIGDEVFFSAVRELVYGTDQPKPGNFTTLYRNTQDFIEIVNRRTGKDLSWFFDVYLYQPKLPKLVETRTEDSVTFSWNTPQNLPFPMPLEVSVNGKVQVLDITSPKTIAVTPFDVVIADPNSKVLRYEARYDNKQ